MSAPELSPEQAVKVAAFGLDQPPTCAGALVDYGGEYGEVFEHPYPDDGSGCEVCGPIIREFDAGATV